MPLPTIVFVAFGCGLAAAFAAGHELRLSLRPFLLTNSFTVYLIFLGFLLIPISVYFYVFHGDWFLLYLIDVHKIPSAIALVGFILEACIGIGGFWIGTLLVRSQRLYIGYAAIGLCILLGLSVIFLFPDRLSVIGSFAQYHGDFGLVGFNASVVMKGAISQGAILTIGIAFLIMRLRYGRANNR